MSSAHIVEMSTSGCSVQMYIPRRTTPPPPDEAQNHRLFKSSNLTAHRLYFIHHPTRNFIFPPFLRSLIALLVVAEKNVGDDVLFFPRGSVVSEFLLYLVLLIVNLNFCKTLCYL